MSDKKTPKTADFLFELYTEEIPASYQSGALRQWKEKLPKLLEEAGLLFESIRFGGTPRRLYFILKNLHSLTKQEEKILRGPPKHLCFAENGEPAPALAGFLKKKGLSVEEIHFEKQGKAEYAMAKVRSGGDRVEEILPALLSELVFSTRFPKTMRWGNLDISYARPILQYFALFGSENLSQKIADKFDSKAPLAFVEPGQGIVGHFILAPEPWVPKSPSEYEEGLRERYVIAEPDERKETIREALRKAGDNLSENERLLEEVTWITENPTVVVGEFPKDFLRIPDIVTLSEMELHQKYFGLLDGKGHLIHRFLIVSNAASSAASTVKAGNERVLKARLSDGAFFYDEDRKIPLADRVEDLKNILYLEGFGSMFDKKERLKKVSSALLLDGFPCEEPKEDIYRACDLLKADLTTQLVYEFDHLQGEIGSIYAREDGEKPAVVSAIREHYLPRHQGDNFPETSMGNLLSIAEKLDNLYSGFISGKKPSSSQDPLALRRQTLYLIELIIRNEWSLDLQPLLRELVSVYRHQIKENDVSEKELVDELSEFILGRLATIFEKEGIGRELIRAGIGTSKAAHDVFGIWQKLSALNLVKKDESFHSMLAAFKRMTGILEELSGKEEEPNHIQSELMTQQEEKNLYACILRWKEQLRSKEKHSIESYVEFFRSLAADKPVVDSFFDQVMVNVDDPAIRKNRLALLAGAVSTAESVLDLSALL